VESFKSTKSVNKKNGEKNFLIVLGKVLFGGTLKHFYSFTVVVIIITKILQTLSLNH
jgi:hypothetical protein